MSIPPRICVDENCSVHGCIFCRIIQREEPARIVAETDRAIAIFPLKMCSFGHTIIFPKVHTENLFTASWEVLSDCMWLAKIVAEQLRTTLGCADMNMAQNNGESAWQTVHHIHFHLMPRREDDELARHRLWPRGVTHEQERLDDLLGKLRLSLPNLSAA